MSFSEAIELGDLGKQKKEDDLEALFESEVIRQQEASLKSATPEHKLALTKKLSLKQLPTGSSVKVHDILGGVHDGEFQEDNCCLRHCYCFAFKKFSNPKLQSVWKAYNFSRSRHYIWCVLDLVQLALLIYLSIFLLGKQANAEAAFAKFTTRVNQSDKRLYCRSMFSFSDVKNSWVLLDSDAPPANGNTSSFSISMIVISLILRMFTYPATCVTFVRKKRGNRNKRKKQNSIMKFALCPKSPLPQQAFVYGVSAIGNLVMEILLLSAIIDMHLQTEAFHLTSIYGDRLCLSGTLSLESDRKYNQSQCLPIGPAWGANNSQAGLTAEESWHHPLIINYFARLNPFGNFVIRDFFKSNQSFSMGWPMDFGSSNNFTSDDQPNWHLYMMWNIGTALQISLTCALLLVQIMFSICLRQNSVISLVMLFAAWVTPAFVTNRCTCLMGRILIKMFLVLTFIFYSILFVYGAAMMEKIRRKLFLTLCMSIKAAYKAVDPVIDSEMLKRIEKCSAGAEGQVYKAVYAGHPVALKAFFTNLLDPSNKSHVLNEAKTLVRLRHPNICTFYGISRSLPLGELSHPRVHTRLHPKNKQSSKVATKKISDKSWKLVMEWCEASLRDVVQRKLPLSQEQCETISLQLAEALAYLHDTGLVHMDIKPDNVMLKFKPRDYDQSVVVKLCDFGFAVDLNRSGHKRPDSRLISSQTSDQAEASGVLRYMAPEYLERLGYRKRPSAADQNQPRPLKRSSGAFASPSFANNEPDFRKMDVYSYSVLLWELFHAPLSSEEDDTKDQWRHEMQRKNDTEDSKDCVETEVKMSSINRPTIYKHLVPEALVSVIEQGWSESPFLRPTMLQIKATIENAQRERHESTEEEDCPIFYEEKEGQERSS